MKNQLFIVYILCLFLTFTSTTHAKTQKSKLHLKAAQIEQNARLIKNICGIIVLIPALLAITGLMRHYKAFVLGFLV